MSSTEATRRIDSLTPEQIARMPEIAAQWIEHGLSTAPADRVAAEAAMKLAYERAGVPWHGRVTWCTSPVALALTDAMLRKMPASVRDSVWDSVWDSVRDSVWASVNSYWQSSWLAFYDYFRSVCEIEACERLDGLNGLHQNAGWWIARNGIALISERPRTLKRDDRGRLHADDGPALEYLDGWAMYVWHGVRVPEQVIRHPERMNAAQIRDERNQEVRRVMLERFGNERYIREIGARKVGKDDYGTLWRAALPGEEPLVMVEVVNATAEPDGSFSTYWLRVPPEMKTAHEAVAWTFGKSAAEYAPVLQS